MKATEKANKDLKKKKKKIKKDKVKVSEEIINTSEEIINTSEEIINTSEELEQINLDPDTPKCKTILQIQFSSESDDDSFKLESDIESKSSIGNSVDDDLSISGSEIESNDNVTTSDDSSNTDTTEKSNSDSEDYSYEYDDQDEKYEELIDKHMLKDSEESNMEYYHYLDAKKKAEIYSLTKDIYEYNGSNIPLRFKVIESEMDMKTKAIALENIDKMAEMDVSTGEHSKMDHWINGLMRIPFGKYNNIPVNPDSSIKEKRKFIQNTYKTLDNAIYGHKEAKTHMLQVIGKWMKNPLSGGNVLAIQGPMGNGKTTLVKEGISKVLNRPFHFIALGGASDSAYFDGHCYTYEGSHWGRIVQILQESKCMNPIIYFDELDKISDTTKGDEITHMLTHLTDPSQNSLFQDNYLPGVNLDL